jgi:hypothetical protein
MVDFGLTDFEIGQVQIVYFGRPVGDGLIAVLAHIQQNTANSLFWGESFAKNAFNPGSQAGGQGNVANRGPVQDGLSGGFSVIDGEEWFFSHR